VDDDAVRLTTVTGEPEAEALCMFLRSNGLECAHRPTPEADSAFEGFGPGGVNEVLVHGSDLEAALELLPRHEG
jgi:hypothetical protein